MRIAQIAPLAESVPPKLYGGTERVVSWLTDELVGLGHDVTLFASGDSRTRAKLVPVCPRALRLSRPRSDPAAACAVLLEAVAEKAGDFDVIHSHIDWVHLPLLRRLGPPFLTTLHGRLDLPDLSLTAQRFADAPFVSISQSQRAPLPGLNWLATIPHGLPPELLKLSERPEGYLAFLGRIGTVLKRRQPASRTRWRNDCGVDLLARSITAPLASLIGPRSSAFPRPCSCGWHYGNERAVRHHDSSRTTSEAPH